MFKRKDAQPNPLAHLHVAIDHDVCFYCGACVAVCPPDSIFLENHNLKIDNQTCTRCERCVHMCPVHALSMQPLVKPANGWVEVRT